MSNATYERFATTTLATIQRKGAVVTFQETAEGDADTSDYDPLTDSFDGDPGTTFTGRAVRVKSDPVALAAQGLTLVNPVTLLVAAKGLSQPPEPNMMATFGSDTVSIKTVEAINPDGATPIMYKVVGEA